MRTKIFFKTSKERARGRHAKKRHHYWHHLQEYIWPTMGWKPFLRWMEIKLKRLPGSGHSVAMGLAVGVFVTFLPYLGFQLLIAFAICYIFNVNFLAAVLGSIVGNPWTFPFIWLWMYEFGHFIMGNNVTAPNFMALDWKSLELGVLWHDFLWPMTVGGVPTGILAGVVVYYFVSFNIASFKKARALYLNKIRDQREKAKRHKLRLSEKRFRKRLAKKFRKAQKKRKDEQ